MGGAEPALSIRLDHPWSASCPDPESRAAPSWVPPLPAASSWPALHWPAGLNAVSSLLWAHSLPKPAEGGEGTVSSYSLLKEAQTHSRREILSGQLGVHSQAGMS